MNSGPVPSRRQRSRDFSLTCQRAASCPGVRCMRFSIEGEGLVAVALDVGQWRLLVLMESHFPDMPPVKPGFVSEEKAQVSADALRQPQAYAELLTPSVASAQHYRPRALSASVEEAPVHAMAPTSRNRSMTSASPFPVRLGSASRRQSRHATAFPLPDQALDEGDHHQ